MTKYYNVTRPNILSIFYFNLLYKKIIKLGSFNKKKIILDFGSGMGTLKKLNKKLNNPSTIINYDIIKDLSDIKYWHKSTFDTIVISQVFYLFSEKKIISTLNKLYSINPKVEIICAFSSQSIFNKIGSYLLGHLDAHEGTKTNPIVERRILLKKCNLLEEISFFSLFRILRLNFKKKN